MASDASDGVGFTRTLTFRGGAAAVAGAVADACAEGAGSGEGARSATAAFRSGCGALVLALERE